MGTGASSYTPPPTPFRTIRHNTIGRGYGDDASYVFETTFTRTDNNVAPVIIKNCMEEYQHVTDFTEPFVYGSLTEKLPQHLLIQGEYFLVRDHSINDGDQPIKTILQKVRCWAPVYWCQQPTPKELQAMIKELEKEGYPEILLFNMREEPVLFIRREDDFIPYTIKTRNNLTDCIITGKIVKEADLYEASIRKEVIALATINDENQFFFYNNTETFQNEPHVYPVEFEDNLLVSEEVYSRLAFSNSKVRYRRLCFPLNGAPSDLEVDHFISIAQDSELAFSTKDQTAMLFTCQTGTGRSNVGAVMGYLLLTHKNSDRILDNLVTEVAQKGHREDKKNHGLDQGFYNAVKKLVAALENGPIIKQQVDAAIDKCCGSHHLRSEIYTAYKRLQHMQAEKQHVERREIWSQYQRCVNYLSRYFFLICFNAYLWEEYDHKLKMAFTRWMNRHPEVNHIRCTLQLPVYSTNHALLSTGQHCLVSDNYVGLDLLGSHIDVRVANFRKINLKSIPVYAMAQPANDGISKVVNYLLNKKVKHTHIVVVNLRNDMTVEIDDATYSVRDATQKEEPIIFPGYSKTELEDKEEALKRTIRKHKTFQIYNELSDPPLEREIFKAYTVLDLADNQRLQTLDMTYYRVPLLCDESPSESDIDKLMEVVCNHCKQDRLRNNSDSAFVFFCRTGKSRSTFAMAVSGLILCHMKTQVKKAGSLLFADTTNMGFPKGSHQGEQERISLPNAQYTKGEFIIVQKLVRMLPDGHQVKREVDFILDEVFNTMTPMMFHLREIIFVTYNKIKKCQTDIQRETIINQSILYLERYIYLILFNAYLHSDASTNWKRPFSRWMKEVGGRAGVYELLDNLCFYDFANCGISDLRKMTERWRYNVPNIPWQGEFV